VGNRTSSHLAPTYTYQPFNKVVTAGSATYSYDANGNLTSKADATGGWQYIWDYEGRLVGVWRPDGLIVTYRYDALGRRVETAKGAGGWERYGYDGSDVVLDRTGDGGVVEYANGLGLDEKLWRRAAGASPLYFLRDHLGSTRALTDSGGGVVEQQGYDTFGGGSGSALTRYGYTGRLRAFIQRE
jgi:YD repeat-containing protein